MHFGMDSKQLIEKISGDLGRPKDEIEALIQSFGVVVSNVATDMDSVTIAGFGSFEPRKRMERVSVNPASGKRLLLPPKLLLGFRPSALLKQKVK